MARGQKAVKDYIRTIVDFPRDGILFRDVTTLYADARGFRMSIDQMLHPRPVRASTRLSGWKRAVLSCAARSRISLAPALCRSVKRGNCRGPRSEQRPLDDPGTDRNTGLTRARN